MCATIDRFRNMVSMSRFVLVIVFVTIWSMVHGHLNATVRAADCINNSTHCHCAMKQAGSNSKCIKPIPGETGRCYMGTCASGYHCDCDAEDICMMVSTVYYSVEGQPTTDTFDCTQNQKEVPRTIVGHTSDFHITAFQEFQLFINSEQIGFGQSNQYKVFTAEIHPGDVIGVIARRQSSDTFGVKLRFTDVEREKRFIDENWYASAIFASSWLDDGFDPTAHGWSSPSLIQTISSESFDADVPWMWLNSEDTVYFRYTIPSV